MEWPPSVNSRVEFLEWLKNNEEFKKTEKDFEKLLVDPYKWNANKSDEEKAKAKADSEKWDREYAEWCREGDEWDKHEAETARLLTKAKPNNNNPNRFH